MLLLLSQRSVGNDPHVDSRESPHQTGQNRAAHELAGPRIGRRPDEDVGGAALVSHPAYNLDEVLALLLVEVDAEDAREAAHGRERHRLLIAQLAPGVSHPERVHLCSVLLTRAPGPP